MVNGAFMVLKGHRSIVNQVRFNPHTYMICSSGVEKVIKVSEGISVQYFLGKKVKTCVFVEAGLRPKGELQRDTSSIHCRMICGWRNCSASGQTKFESVSSDVQTVDVPLSETLISNDTAQ